MQNILGRIFKLFLSLAEYQRNRNGSFFRRQVDKNNNCILASFLQDLVNKTSLSVFIGNIAKSLMNILIINSPIHNYNNPNYIKFIDSPR